MSDVVLVSPAPGGPRARLDGRRARVVASCAVLLLAAAALGAAARLRPAPPPLPALPEAADMAWIEVPEPVRDFALDAPLLAGLPQRYSVRRRSNGEREDLLLFGTPGADAPFARLRLHSLRGEGDAQTPLFATVAREAAEAGLSIEHAGLADLLPSRLGDFEAVDLILADAAATHFSCNGLRLGPDRNGVTLSGLVCGALGRPVERAALSCLVDRLAPAPGGTDRAAIGAFAGSAHPRDPNCAREVPAVPPGGKLVTPPASSRRR